MKPEDFTNSNFLLAFFSFLFLLLPGVASIFIFDKDLFLNLDWIKLVLLATAITLPLSLINIILLIIQGAKNGSKTEDFLYFTLGTTLAGLSIYVVLAISYFITMSLGKAISVALVSDLVVFGWLSMQTRKK